MAHTLSVLIPCKNEQRNLRPCVESVLGLADEVVVADSGSTDRTLAIARELGCRILEREYVNSANFKNWAIPQCVHPWVLIVDADERVPPQLASEIRALLAGAPAHDGYRIYRRNFLFGQEVRYSGWQTDDVLRLFRRDLCRYEERRVHADVVVSGGNIGWLRERLVHYTAWTVDQFLGKKVGRYTTWGAEDLWDRGRRAGWTELALRPFLRFLRHYVLRRGFLDGRVGWIMAVMSAFYVFVRFAKLWEMEHGIAQPDPEAARRPPSDGPPCGT